MIYELYLEEQLADIRQDLGMQLSYAIDDVNKYGSRETSFSKTIVLPGTANNNRLLGFVSELGSNNTYLSGGANINSNFNPAQTTKAELRANGLLLLKGVFRLTGIVKEGELIEYEGNLFGELGGFISAIGNGKLEDLDFSEYNHNYTRDNIVASWDRRIIKNVNGSFVVEELLPGIEIYRIIINNTYDLKIDDSFFISPIFITNATLAFNNKTYTNFIYFYDASTSQAIITVLGTTVAPDDNDDFTISYISGDSGSGYFYPLIDYGRYSADKLSYDYRTFRPALFVKEYIDKMFIPTGYTYESNFFNTDFFRRLIVPNNFNKLTKRTSDLLHAVRNTNKNLQNSDGSIPYNNDKTTIVDYPIIIFSNGFSDDGDPNFTFNLSETTIVNINYQLNLTVYPDIVGDAIFPGDTPERRLHEMKIRLFKNGDILNVVERRFFYFSSRTSRYNLSINENIQTTINQNDTFKVQLDYLGVFNELSYVTFSSLKIISTNPVTASIQLNDPIFLDEIIPRNILQKDFFTWIMKMFNLYITEDKVKENHLIIEPYKDYYDLTEYDDWTYKVARDKPWNIKPMGMLNGRFFEYKYKEDNDFYNEEFKKKYNLPYGSNLHDTGFQFAKDKQTTDVGFSPTPLVKYSGRDKVVSAIYKVSKGNSVDQEEQTDSNIRILMIKKITGVAQWYITNNGADLVQPPQPIGDSLTSYGYAGHFDDPVNPTIDINFGAAEEIYFTPNEYPSNNLFNTYWSGYIAEIADKDSKILTCHVYLTELDIAQLDFSKPVFIDGSLWRINKIMDFDASAGELTKVELLKVINNG